MTKRHVRLPSDVQEAYADYIEGIGQRLDSATDLGDTVQEILIELNGDQPVATALQEGHDVPAGDRVRIMSYHPANAAIESEWYAEKDEYLFGRSKPLQWLWRQFDRTSLAANVAFGLPFRQMLAKRLFAEAGDNLRIFRDVTMSYGHNITIGDNCVVHDNVHLDDRGELIIGDRVSISEDAHVYTHDHDVVDQTAVTNYRTVLKDDARITFGAMVLAGVEIGENALVGARSIVQSDIPAHHVVVGAPARSVRVKPGWDSVALPLDEELPDRKADRRIDRPVPADIDVFDEFERQLRPPDK